MAATTTDLILTTRTQRDEWLGMETSESGHHGIDDASPARFGSTYMEWTDRSRFRRNATREATQ